MRRIGEWAATRRWLVVGLWVGLLVGMTALAGGSGADFRDEFSLTGTDSQAATDALAEAFPELTGTEDLVVWRVAEGSALASPAAGEAEAVLAEVAALDSVAGVVSPFEGGPVARAQVSADGQTAFARLQWSTPATEIPTEDLQAVEAAVTDAAGAGLEIGVSGLGVSQLAAPGLTVWEIAGVLFAAVVLYLLFRSVVAMLVPLVSAIAALGVGTSAMVALTNVMVVPTTSATVATLLALGVGIDYALFIVNRYRAALRAGRSVHDAVVEATDTSGRAVVFAGTTVVISLLGLLLIGVGLISGTAIAVALVVLFTILSSITLVPAVLSLLGARVLSRRERRALAAGELADPTASAPRRVSWIGTVLRRPGLVSLAGGLVMVVLALPVLDIRLATADQGNDPAGSLTRTGYDLLSEGFGPGVNGPLLVVARTPDGAAATAAPALVQRLAELPGVAAVSPAQTSADGSVAVVRVTPVSGPQSEATGDLLATVRGGVTDQAQAATPGLEVYVGGSTAVLADFTDRIVDALPAFFTFIVGLSMLLLVLAFRSLLVPLVGGLMNALGAASAFGVVVAVFQWGWGLEVLGVDRAGPIDPFIPVMAFAIVFGLSMDYQVFLVSRVHEEWTRHRDNRAAVRVGLTQTRPVITAAALVMVFVFAGFVTGDDRGITMIGLALAVGVFLDAFVLRQTVVPGLMVLAGRANWWLPRGLDRLLPHLAVEPARPATGPEQPAGEARREPVGR